MYKNAQLTSGLNMCISPSVAPGKVIPRIKNIVMTMYGNPAVKQTTQPEDLIPFMMIK